MQFDVTRLFCFQGNILEDESAIEILSSSKVLSLEISEKQKIASATEAEIDETRNGYKPVRLRCLEPILNWANFCFVQPEKSLVKYLVINWVNFCFVNIDQGICQTATKLCSGCKKLHSTCSGNICPVR